MAPIDAYGNASVLFRVTRRAVYASLRGCPNRPNRGEPTRDAPGVPISRKTGCHALRISVRDSVTLWEGIA